ncbi:histidine kinase [Halobacteriales archaeon QS_4_62_28]|nr:MAG: histidine kinase [Halobacteriales archaeon QS_4_62_28]
MDRQGVPTEQLMTPDIVTVTSDTTIDEAVDTIIENDIGSLMVVDEDDHLSGVITNNDFVDFLADGEYGTDVTIDQFMTDEVITINADDSIQTAAARMITNSISHLPVVDDDGKTLGMLSTTDITAYSVSRA